MNKIINFLAICFLAVPAFSETEVKTVSVCPSLFGTVESSTVVSGVVSMVLKSKWLQGRQSIKLDLEKANKIVKAHENSKFIWHKVYQADPKGIMRCGFSFQPVDPANEKDKIIILVEDK